MKKYSISCGETLTSDDIESLLHEADDCLKKATQKENDNMEYNLEARAAKTLFTHYYGPILLDLIGSSLKS